MKRQHLLIALAIFIAACGQTAKEEQTTEDQNENVLITEESVPEEKIAVEQGKVMKLNNETFRQLVHDYKADPTWSFKGDLPCIIDFYADWCAPCRTIAPILDELAKEYEGQINIFKVDTDVEAELSSFYGIQYLPTLLFCKNGAEPVKQVGAFSKADYVNMIEKDLL
jgi:thioredoxin 1